jgi:hypothetical protein
MTHTFVSRKDHLTFRGNVKQGRHGWLRLTPAYSLHVVEDILRDASADDFALDPFSGTATTPLASAVHGVPCHAVDINPFLIWLGNLKCSVFSAADRENLRHDAKRITSQLRKRKTDQTEWVPDLKNIEKWWDAPALQSLSRLHTEIGKRNDSIVVELLKVCFLRTMIGCAHVSFSHQSMSFKQRRPSSPTLFELHCDPESVWDSFLTEADWVADTLLDEQPRAEAQVFYGDSRSVKDGLPRGGYSLVITSPPYPNRMSYIRELRPYMYWLGYLTNGRQAGELDWQAIGGTWGCATSLLNSWEADKAVTIPYEGFDQIVTEISEGHKALGRYVHKYFEDMVAHVSSLTTVLARGARCHYIVGNSKFYDTLLPVEQIFASLFEHAGFANVRIETLRKRTSKKELFEYCVYAEAPGAAKHGLR